MGFWTASISTFAERHSAYHFDAGFNECLQPRHPRAGDGRSGGGSGTGLAGPQRSAGQLVPPCPSLGPAHALPDTGRLRRLASAATRFLPGSPRRCAPSTGAFPDPTRPKKWPDSGPVPVWDGWPRQPQQIDDMNAVRRMFDGYDSGVRYADYHLGTIVDTLARLGVLEETAVMVSSDHGENLGELGIYCDHQTADAVHDPPALGAPMARPCRLGIGGGRAALPGRRDGHRARSRSARRCPIGGTAGPSPPSSLGRVVVAITWSCPTRRGPPSAPSASTAGSASAPTSTPTTASRPVLLFDLDADPHEQHDVADDHPDVVTHALALLGEWGDDGPAPVPHRCRPALARARGGRTVACRG